MKAIWIMAFILMATSAYALDKGDPMIYGQQGTVTDSNATCFDGVKGKLKDCGVRPSAFFTGTAFPTSPTPQNGDAFYRTDVLALYIYYGGAWQLIGGAIPIEVYLLLAETGDTLTTEGGDAISWQ